MAWYVSLYHCQERIVSNCAALGISQYSVDDIDLTSLCIDAGGLLKISGQCQIIHIFQSSEPERAILGSTVRSKYRFKVSVTGLSVAMSVKVTSITMEIPRGFCTQ